MQAIQLIQTGKALQAREVPEPQPGARDAVLRVCAAGICHSDAHYRSGLSYAGPVPLTLGHEVAGLIESVGTDVGEFKPGDRVCVHYLATCGECEFCRKGNEQFCPKAAMIGKHRDGGYAEKIVMPVRSLVHLPGEVSFEQGAVMMCSAATSLHALRKARLKRGESVAIFGVGGLGMAAVQIAKAAGANEIFAVDIKENKLRLAKQLGAVPVNAAESDAVKILKELTSGRGVDVALELIGLPLTMRQAVLSLAVQGRAALTGITDKSFQISPYQELLNKEAEIIGVSDHLASELPSLLEWARHGKLEMSKAITRTVPLEAAAINEVLDGLESFGEDVRVVIVPEQMSEHRNPKSEDRSRKSE